MLEVWYIILDLFQLVLEVSFKLTPDGINKSLKILKVFPEEGFEFWLRDWNSALMAVLMLSSSKAYDAMEKWGCKWDMVYLGGT